MVKVFPEKHCEAIVQGVIFLAPSLISELGVNILIFQSYFLRMNKNS